MYVLCIISGPSPGTKLGHRVIDCTDHENDFKLCPVEGASVVQNVEFKYGIGNIATCTKGLNYGIFNNSMWVHKGCSGIFDVDYYEGKNQTNEVQSIVTIVSIYTRSCAVVTRQKILKCNCFPFLLFLFFC